MNLRRTFAAGALLLGPALAFAHEGHDEPGLRPADPPQEERAAASSLQPAAHYLNDGSSKLHSLGE